MVRSPSPALVRPPAGLAVAGLALLVTVAACPAPGGPPGPPGPVTAGPGAPSSPRPAPPPAPPPPPVDDGPTADQSLAWIVETIEAGGEVTAAEVEARFSPDFLAQVPVAQVIAITEGLGQQLPPMKQVKLESKPPRAVVALYDTAAGGVRITVGMTATTPRRIDTLLFQPATAEVLPRTYGDAVAQLARAGARSQLFVAELVRGKCVPRQNHNPTQRMAIGSTFKLWVLLALDDKLRKTRALTWESTLAIRDDWKSLPSGVMQDLAAGTTPTLRDYAEKMISISDNTATDHLIGLVGRKAVEKALVASHHGAPRANTPFFTTREMFVLKLVASPEERAAYRKASVARRRKLLAGLRDRAVDIGDAGDWKAPRDLDLEWFADARDLCNVMATLGSRARFEPSSELLRILGKNPGVPPDPARWSYVGFKGGSEPGVMNLTWLARRADGKWFVIVIGVNDDTRPVDEALVLNAAAGTLAILGNEADAAAPPPDALQTAGQCRADESHCCLADGTVVKPGGCQPSYPDDVRPATRRGADGRCEPVECHLRCLPPTARISTPLGDRPVAALAVGDPVWTVDAAGARVAGRVIAVGSTPVPARHALVEIRLADGRVVRASAGHPDATGRPLGELVVGDRLDGARVDAVTAVAADGDRTWDLASDGPGGAYWADGVLLGSTLAAGATAGR